MHEIQNVNTIPELSDFLTELKNQQSGESALAYALQAQLQVLEVVRRMKITSIPFDIMLESLETAVEKADNEREKSEFRQQAAVMVNCMVCFMEVKLDYRKPEWNEEGRTRLKEACEMLAESACAIAGMAATGGAASGDVAKKLAATLLNSILSNKDDFCTRTTDWFSKKNRLAGYKSDFYTFLESAFDKLMKYRDLFGQSPVLRNLVLRYKDELINKGVKDKSRKLREIDSDNPIFKNKPGAIGFFYHLENICFIVLGICFIILGIYLGNEYLCYLFKILGPDKWEYNWFITWIIGKFGWVPAAMVLYVGVGIASHTPTSRRKENNIAKEYYTVLADKLSVFECK